MPGSGPDTQLLSRATLRRSVQAPCASTRLGAKPKRHPQSNAETLHLCGLLGCNDAIMVIAFAPIVGLLLGLSAITVPWGTLVLSVVLYIVVPVIVSQLVRSWVLANGGQPALDRLLGRLGPASLVALLATLVLLFGFQGEQILAQPMVIALLAVPMLIQVYLNAGLAYALNRVAGEQWPVPPR